MKPHAKIKEQLAHYDYLPAEAKNEVDAHVATCAECAGELGAWRSSDRTRRNGLDSAPGQRAEESIARSQARVAEFSAAVPTSATMSPEPRLALRSEPQTPVAETTPPLKEVPGPAPRLLIPMAFAVLFVSSLWLGMRDMERRPNPPALTQTVVAVGRGTPQPGLTPQPARATIVFACDNGAAMDREYAELARRFEKENPDVRVELKSYRDLLGNVEGASGYLEVMQEIAAQADAFCLGDIAPLVQGHLLYDLDPLIARDPAFEVGDFYEAVLSSVRHNGSIYAVPARFQPALIRYDPAAFDAAGIARPLPGWTWDDFLTAATALTRRDGGSTQRWGFGEDSNLIFNARFVAALDDPAFLSAAAAENPFLNSSVVDLFRWYERLYVNARAAAMPRSFEDWTGESYMPAYVDPEEISHGKMAMWTDLLYPNARRQGKPAPFPSRGAGGKGSAGPVYTDPAWAMAAETLHPQATWRWLSYLSRNPPPDVQQIRLPARRSLVQKTSFWTSLPSNEADAYRYVLENLDASAVEPPAQPMQALYEELRSMVAGRMTVTELLARRRIEADRSTGQSSARATIRFAAPNDDLPAYEDVAREFEREWGVHIQLLAREGLMDAEAETAPPWTQMRQIARRADVLAGPEVASLTRSGRSEGILHDLTSLASGLPKADFYPNTVESLQWRGKTFAVPARVSAYLVHYNRWMFDQNGVAYPQPGWTWDDFAQTAQAATRRGQDNLWWYGAKDGLSNQLMLLTARTGPLVNYAAQPAQALLDQPSAVEAVAWYAALVQADVMMVPHALLPDIGGQPRYSSIDPPVDGAMWVAPAQLSALKALRQGSIGTVPFPIAGDDDRTNPIEIVEAYAISASSGQKVAGWQWIQYLLDHQPANDARHPGVPARRIAMMGVGVDVDAEAQQVYRFALEHARPVDPLRSENFFVERALKTAVTNVVRGVQDAAAALEDAQRLAESGISH